MKKKVFAVLLAAVIGICPGAMALIGADAFVSDNEENYIPIPAAYEAVKTVKNLGGEYGFMNHPEDIFIDGNDTIWIADAENNRVLKMDTGCNVTGVITEACGKTLNKPRGVYVHSDGSIWIADSGNLRIATLNADESDRREYMKPESTLLENNFTFDVQKIAVAPTGYIYALKGVNLMTMDETNTFRGYLGADKVGFSLSRTLIRLFGSKSQIERTQKQQPASYSNFCIAADGMIYGILANKATAQIRKLNTVGSNTYPEDTYGFVIEMDGKEVEPTFSDICVEDNGIITVTDRASGLLYQYDQEGNLICCFGGQGSTAGTFQIPISVDADSEGNLYVLDYSANTLTVFRPTHFIETVHQAVTLHGEGRYQEAMVYWQEALEIDSGYALAHQGVAKIEGKEEKWSESLRSYYLADDKEGYSDAFSEYRHEYFRNHFLLVVVCAVAILFAAVKLLGLIKRKGDEWADDVQFGRGLK